MCIFELLTYGLTFVLSSFTLQSPNYLIEIFTHLKLCLASTSSELKLFRFDKMEVNYFHILLIGHVVSSTSLKVGT